MCAHKRKGESFYITKIVGIIAVISYMFYTSKLYLAEKRIRWVSRQSERLDNATEQKPTVITAKQMLFQTRIDFELYIAAVFDNCTLILGGNYM